MTMDEHDRFSERVQQNLEPGSVSMADFDHDDYRPFLDGMDLTDAQKSEFLLIVWDIMRMWVEMNWPLDSCGQIIEAMIDPDTSDSVDVESGQTE